jgi:hypothetical protein
MGGRSAAHFFFIKKLLGFDFPPGEGKADKSFAKKERRARFENLRIVLGNVTDARYVR